MMHKQNFSFFFGYSCLNVLKTGPSILINQSHFRGWLGQRLKFKIWSIPLNRRTEHHQPLPAPLTANKSFSNPSNNGPSWPTIPSPLPAQPEGPDHHKTPPRVANLRLSISPVKRQYHKGQSTFGRPRWLFSTSPLPSKSNQSFTPLPLSPAILRPR